MYIGGWKLDAGIKNIKPQIQTLRSVPAANQPLTLRSFRVEVNNY